MYYLVDDTYNFIALVKQYLNMIKAIQKKKCHQRTFTQPSKDIAIDYLKRSNLSQIQNYKNLNQQTFINKYDDLNFYKD